MEKNYNKIVIEYIDKYLCDEPIFLEEIRNYVVHKTNIKNKKELDKVYANINVIINRMNSEKKIKTYSKGIYYKPTNNILGEMPLDKTKIINKKYLKNNNGKINGYITGEKLFNQLGLTTQIPNTTIIVTNNYNRKDDYKVEYLNIILRKSKIKITNENYQYLQLIDILANKDKINIKNKKYNEIIYNEYIIKNKLDFEKIIKYARETKNKKILEKLFILAK